MTTNFRKILAPIYFDERSAASLDFAAYFARANDGTVYLLHVVPTDEIHLLRDFYRPTEGGGSNIEWAEKVSRERLYDLATDRLRGVRYEILTHIDSDPVAGILEQQRRVDADLIALASHARSGLSRLVLRSVAERVVRESPRPVLVAQRQIDVATHRPFRSILCPLDLDRSHSASLEYAAQLARDSQAFVHLLHVVPTENLMLRREIYHPRPDDGENVVHAEKVARQTLDALAREHFDSDGYEIHVHVSPDPAKTILEMERDIRPDLLIMVTQGLSGIIHLIVGSVTEKLIRQGYCPVLTVRATV
jgi:nucleotide-binding universal stress UspA family protein